MRRTKPGMEIVRKLRSEEIEFLKAAYDDIKSIMPKEKEVCWLNLYVRSKQTQENWQYNANFHDFILNLIGDAYKGIEEEFPEKHIISYGFITNPANSNHIQHFHCDYTETSSNLFVPLTNVSLQNATEFITTNLSKAKMDPLNNYGHSPEDVMENEGIEFLEVVQVVCKPYNLIRLNPKTPHRGIANTADYDRTMLFVTIDNHHYDLEERVHFSESEGIMAFRMGSMT